MDCEGECTNEGTTLSLVGLFIFIPNFHGMRQDWDFLEMRYNNIKNSMVIGTRGRSGTEHIILVIFPYPPISTSSSVLQAATRCIHPQFCTAKANRPRRHLNSYPGAGARKIAVSNDARALFDDDRT